MGEDQPWFTDLLHLLIEHSLHLPVIARFVKEARILSVQLKHSTVQASRLQVFRKSLTERRFLTGLGRHVLHVDLKLYF